WSARRDRRNCTLRPTGLRQRRSLGGVLLLAVFILRTKLADEAQFGLEVHVMREFQVRDETCRFHIVGVVENEFLVLRGVFGGLAEFAGAKRAIDKRHRHRLALIVAIG